MSILPTIHEAVQRYGQPIRTKGPKTFSRCPFCDDKATHMEITQKGDGGVFYCHRCNENGGTLALMEALSGETRSDILKSLREAHSISKPKYTIKHPMIKMGYRDLEPAKKELAALGWELSYESCNWYSKMKKIKKEELLSELEIVSKGYLQYKKRQKFYFDVMEMNPVTCLSRLNDLKFLEAQKAIPNKIVIETLREGNTVGLLDKSIDVLVKTAVDEIIENGLTIIDLKKEQEGWTAVSKELEEFEIKLTSEEDINYLLTFVHLEENGIEKIEDDEEVSYQIKPQAMMFHPVKLVGAKYRIRSNALLEIKQIQVNQAVA